MCRAIEEGGRRCPKHTPEYRRAGRAAKKAREKRPRRPRDIECPECEAGIRRWTETDADGGQPVHRAERCERCGGCGYLTDAAGRLHSDVAAGLYDSPARATVRAAEGVAS